MTDLPENNHTVFVWKNQKINDLMSNFEAFAHPENIRSIDRRPHVTLRWISCRFRITYTLLQSVLTDFEDIAPVYSDAVDYWIDDAAWVEICNHPMLANTISEAARETVLHLLGHYQRVAA